MMFLSKIFGKRQLFSLVIVTIFGGISISCAAVDRDAKWATPLEADGLKNFYKVSDTLYRSAQPKKGGLKSLENLGVKTVISIRETSKDVDVNENDKTNLNLVHIPLVTTEVNTDDIVQVLKAYMDGPQPVLIHCRHGSDRTGLMVGMYRVIFEHWSKEDARDELINGDYGYHSMFKNIPQTLMDADTDYIKEKLGIQ